MSNKYSFNMSRHSPTSDCIWIPVCTSVRPQCSTVAGRGGNQVVGEAYNRFCTIALLLCIIQTSSQVKKISLILSLICKRHGYVYLKWMGVLSSASASFWLVFGFVFSSTDRNKAHDWHLLSFAQKSSFSLIWTASPEKQIFCLSLSKLDLCITHVSHHFKLFYLYNCETFRIYFQGRT